MCLVCRYVHSSYPYMKTHGHGGRVVKQNYGRFPKFHRVLLGRDPGTLKSDIVSKNNNSNNSNHSNGSNHSNHSNHSNNSNNSNNSNHSHNSNNSNHSNNSNNSKNSKNSNYNDDNSNDNTVDFRNFIVFFWAVTLAH